MNIPDLSKVITPDDISKKGGGKYSADYVNWAKVAHLLQINAPGWQFHLRPAIDGGHVWKAPNNTGYLVGYFTSPESEVTADFIQSVMNNRNDPIPFDKITARDLTDTHRRALCAAACFTFGLAYQLWAKEKIEDPHQEKETAAQGDHLATHQNSSEDKITQKQLNMLLAIANKREISAEAQKAIVTGQFGFTSRKLITQDKYPDILSAYENYKTGDIDE